MTPLIFSKLNVNRIERQSECNTVFNVYLLVFVDPSTKGRQVVSKFNDRYQVLALSSITCTGELFHVVNRVHYYSVFELFCG